MGYYWTFGDYAGSNEVNPEPIYASDGNYTVTLRARSDQSMMGVLAATVAGRLMATDYRLYLPLALVTAND
ncbi:MAG: PKD domain-containing protein [Anaerolineae bacterium]|nr:PKD domain-containing protein [Anaerolineae bacterium]